MDNKCSSDFNTDISHGGTTGRRKHCHVNLAALPSSSTAETSPWLALSPPGLVSGTTFTGKLWKHHETPMLLMGKNMGSSFDCRFGLKSSEPGRPFSLELLHEMRPPLGGPSNFLWQIDSLLCGGGPRNLLLLLYYILISKNACMEHQTVHWFPTSPWVFRYLSYTIHVNLQKIWRVKHPPDFFKADTRH